MAKNHENKVYAGGIRNRINRISMRTGAAMVQYNGPHTDQHDGTTVYEPRSVIGRVTNEPPVPRSSQDGVKDNDV